MQYRKHKPPMYGYLEILMIKGGHVIDVQNRKINKGGRTTIVIVLFRTIQWTKRWIENSNIGCQFFIIVILLGLDDQTSTFSYNLGGHIGFMQRNST